MQNQNIHDDPEIEMTCYSMNTQFYRLKHNRLESVSIRNITTFPRLDSLKNPGNEF